MAKGIWAFAEQNGGQLAKVSFEVVSAARKVADELGEEVVAVICGGSVEGLAGELAKYGADKVVVVEDAKLENYNSGAYVGAIAEVVKANQPKAFFVSNTAVGKDLAPRVAERVGAGCASDVIDIAVDGGKIVFTRPIYAGKALAKVAAKTETVVASLRPKVFAAAENAKAGAVEKAAASISDADMKAVVKEVQKTTTGKAQLHEADIIVSGGRGMGGPENYKVIEELAELLGAAVGASRAAVDAGWRPHGDQVGQTGKVVSPTLYVAAGISGAMQHLAGMGSSKYIVAINKDPEANIFKVADYGIQEDLFKVVPSVTEEVRKVK